MKTKFKFKKSALEERLTLLEQADLKRVYCMFDEAEALTILRDWVKCLLHTTNYNSLTDVLKNSVNPVDKLEYAVPCLCDVEYTVTTTEVTHEFTRHYIAYGVTERDVDAYLDFLILSDIQYFDEFVPNIKKVDYVIGLITPCVK